MIDESTFRSIEKSYIIYVRYVDDFEAKTTFYGLLNLNESGNANNIVKALTHMWEKDDLDAKDSSGLAADNASTFTGSII